MASRWRREDYDKVKHDKCFTDWKVLVGPSDWREGGERFRALNLPGPHAGSGVYELGVTLPAWKTVDHYSESASLKSEDIMVVYVGHAEHIRKRLQRYGQAGACLEGSRSTRPPPVNKFPELNFGRFADSTQSSSIGEELQGKYGQDRLSSRMIGGRRGSRVDVMQVSIPQSRSPIAQPATSPRGPRLFSEVFALGCSVAFRWASTRSKEVAEYVVHDLTDVFDYAWNRGGGNSDIRSQDIVGKIVLGKRAPDTSCCTSTGSRWSGVFPFTRKPVIGIKIAAYKPKSNLPPHTKSSLTSPCKALFTLLREKPHLMLIPGKSSTKHSEFTKINIPVNRCGSFLPSGLVCNALPQQGRTRCPIHDSSSSSSTRRNASRVASFDHSPKLITSRISIPKPPLSSCFPLRFQKKPQQQSEVKQRGSISFSTWLSRSVEIKNKSIEWLLAMEEIKRRSYDCTSTSPIFKPESPSPGILTLSDGADIPEIIEEHRHCPALDTGLSSTGHCIPLLDIEHCKTVYTVHCTMGDAIRCPREGTGHCSISGTGHYKMGDTGHCKMLGTGCCRMGDTGHCMMGDTGRCKMLDTGCCRMLDTGHCVMGYTGHCKMVDTGMPYSIVPKGSPVRWPPSRSDAYATRYVPPQYFL